MADTRQAQDQLREQLEETQKQLHAQKEKYLAEKAPLEARTKELEEARLELDRGIAALRETPSTDSGGQEAGEAGKRRSELEAELARNKLEQAQLQEELEQVQRQLQTLKENYLTEKSRLEGRTEELLAEQSVLEQKLRNLNEALAFETKRRGAIEKMAVESFKRCRELEGQLAKQQAGEKTLQGQLEHPENAKRRGELEAELARNKEVQAKLCEQLRKAQKQLQAQAENGQPPRLDVQLPELQVAQAQVEQQISRLSEALAQETRRRESAEQQARETGQSRTELETQLAHTRQELEASHKQLQIQVDRSGAVKQARLEGLIRGITRA